MSLSKTFTAEHVHELVGQISAWLKVNAMSAATAEIGMNNPGTNNVVWTETAETTGDDNTPPDPNAPTTDKTGMIWDARIHAGSKGLNKDGTWRYKKGAAKELISAVEAEIKAKIASLVGGNLTSMAAAAANAAGQMTTATTAFPMPANGVPPMPAGDGAFTGQQMQMPQMQQPVMQMPQPPQMQMPQMQQPQPNAATVLHNQPVMNFSEFMQRFVKLTQTVNPATGQAAINQTNIPTLCQYVGQMIGRPLHAITDIANDPVAISHAVNKLTVDGVWHLAN